MLVKSVRLDKYAGSCGLEEAAISYNFELNGEDYALTKIEKNLRCKRGLEDSFCKDSQNLNFYLIRRSLTASKFIGITLINLKDSVDFDFVKKFVCGTDSTLHCKISKAPGYKVHYMLNDSEVNENDSNAMLFTLEMPSLTDVQNLQSKANDY